MNFVSFRALFIRQTDERTEICIYWGPVRAKNVEMKCWFIIIQNIIQDYFLSWELNEWTGHLTVMSPWFHISESKSLSSQLSWPLGQLGTWRVHSHCASSLPPYFQDSPWHARQACQAWQGGISPLYGVLDSEPLWWSPLLICYEESGHQPQHWGGVVLLKRSFVMHTLREININSLKIKLRKLQNELRKDQLLDKLLSY